MALPVSINDPTSAGNVKGIATILVIVVALVIVAVIASKGIRGISAFFEGLGLKDTKDEKENNAKVETGVESEMKKGVTSPWSPAFYQNAPGGSLLLPSARATELAKTLWSSVGRIYDSPSVAAGVIKQLKTKTQVSQLMDVFFKLYSVDGLKWMQNKFDTAEQKEILSDILLFVKKLPDYNK